MTVKYFYFLCVFQLVASAKFPSEINKCRFDDSQCIMDVTNGIFKSKFKGFPQLGIPVLDPLIIDKMELERDEKSSVNVQIVFKNVSMIGYQNAKLLKVTGFKMNPVANKIEFVFRTPILHLVGQYSIDGKVLILPIQGRGNCNITSENAEINIKIISKAVEKNGKTYMQIDKSKSDLKITRMYYNFENLFNGNKALGDNMNQFLNENWNDIFNEIKGPLVKGFGKVFTTIIGHVLSGIPYNELFSF